MNLNLKNRIYKLESNVDCSLVKVWFSNGVIQNMNFDKLLKLVLSGIRDKSVENTSVKKFEIIKSKKNYGILSDLIEFLIRETD